MPYSEVVIVFQWWSVLFLVGAVAFPLTKYLFNFYKSCQFTPDRGKVDIGFGWWDGGYLFSKAVGMAVVTWIVYVFGTVRIVPFSVFSIILSLFILFVIGLVLHFPSSVFSSQLSDFGLSVRRFASRLKTERPEAENRKLKTDNWFRSSLLIIVEEFFFFAALLFWSWVKAHEPSIHGLEKFMDYGFMQSILNSRFFPPADMWYAGSSINYYYFGHMVVAVVTKLSGLDLAFTFNLMLATIFALTLTMSFSIGYQLLRLKSQNTNHNDQHGRKIFYWDLAAGVLTAFFVTMAGNMQTMYAFTRGYTGDNVKPFWQLLWPIGEFLQKLPEGMRTYWYANATRFIPFTIHEFPSYSFVVSDIHGHVLSLPFVLLTIALLIHLFSNTFQSAHVSLTKIIGRTNRIFLQESFAQLVFYGFLVGVLLMTNALDGPIYLALLGSVLVVSGWKKVAFISSLVFVFAGLTSLPFLYHFKSFVNGLAVNCPPAFLANSRFGPLIFEGVEKCQHSPLWMMALLWGFFIYCGGSLMIKIGRIGQIGHIRHIWDTKFTQVEKLLVVFFLFSIVLIIFPEFFYFKDIYPAHFRSNTMFKLGYQAFILFSIVAGYAITHALFRRSRIFLILLIPQLFLVSIYPYFSVRSYFGELREYKGLNGLEWLAREYPTDYSAIEWLNSQNVNYERFAIVEADGDSYTDSARFSAFTGIPTIIGWPVHEWLWRGSYDVVAPRREEVRKIYESTDVNETKQILEKYHIRYIIVGTLERQKYRVLNEENLQRVGAVVFVNGETRIYQIAQSGP